MLNNLTNFFNLIVGRKIKTQLQDSDLIAVGTKQSSAKGDYKPTAIKFSDLKAQLTPAPTPSFPYTYYTAMLTQSGTDAPIPDFEETTITGTPVWSYVAEGVYRLTITGAFSGTKVFVMVKAMDGMYALADAYKVDANVIEVRTYNILLAQEANNVLFTPAPFEVRVYS